MLGLLLITGAPALMSGLRKATGKIAEGLRAIRHDQAATKNNESSVVRAAVVAMTPEQWERAFQSPDIIQGIHTGGRYWTVTAKSGSAT